MNRASLLIGALLSSLLFTPMVEAANSEKIPYCIPRPKAKPKAKVHHKAKHHKVHKAKPKAVVPAPVPVPVPAPAPQANAPQTGNLQVSFRDDMGPAYKVVSYNYLLDGKPFMSGTQDAQTVTRAVPTGNHVLAMEVIYRGEDPVFEYWEDYRMKLTSRADVKISNNGKVAVTTVGRLTDGLFLRAERRPDLKVDLTGMPAKVAMADDLE
jgi:hypothetical protein